MLGRILENSLKSEKPATRNPSTRQETVGSRLATIPGILQVHEQSYNAIGDHISSIGSGLIAAISNGLASMTKTIEKNAQTLHHDLEKNAQTIHQDAVVMNNKLEQSHEDAVLMKESMHNDLEKNARTLHQDMEKLDQTQHDGMHSLMSSFTDEDNNINRLTETLHDGLDTISLKMPEKDHLEEAVHDGFHSVVESLSDPDELGSIIHDGLHDISEHIDTKSEFNQVLIILLLLGGFQQIFVYSSMPINRCSTPALMGSKMPSRMLAILLSIFPPPLVLHVSWLCFSYQPSNINTISPVGNAFGTQVAGLLSNNLNDIMDSIDGHGDTVKEALRVQQVFRAEEQLEVEAKQLEEEESLVGAMQNIISAITSSQDKLSNAVENGHNQVSLSITRGSEKLTDVVTTSQDKVSQAIASGSGQISSSLDSGQQKISTSVLTAADAINDVVDVVEVCLAFEEGHKEYFKKK